MHLGSAVSSFFALLVLLFFACGLNGIVSIPLILTDSYSEAGFKNKYLRSGYFLLGILAFCLIANYFLLLPPIIELFPGWLGSQSHMLHVVIMNLLCVLILIVSIFGAALFLRLALLAELQARWS